MKKPLILVVESSPSKAARLEAGLRGCGYETVVALGAAQAVEAAKAREPDLAVCELDLADGEGTQLCRELRELPNAAKVLIYAAREDDESKAESLASGAAAFVPKSDGQKALIECAGAVLDGRDQALPSLRLLVADDNKVNLMLAVWALGRAGHDPLTAEDGEQALSLARAVDFDVILLDVQMPGLDGVEVARLIREGGGKNASTPILAFSGHSEEELGRIGMEFFDGFLSKPFEIVHFATLAAKALAARSSERG